MASSQTPPPVALLLTPEEVAKALRVGRSKVYELIRSGSLRSVKIGGSRRISATALAEFVTSLERAA
jgi:excisionase family DNA binding protein